MSHKQSKAVFGFLLQQMFHLGACAGIQRMKRFVEKKKRSVESQRPGKSDAGAHSS